VIEARTFSKDNLNDVMSLLRECGLQTSEDYIRHHLLSNPIFSASNQKESGIVVYDDNICVAFQGMVFRILHVKQTEVCGREGTVLAIRKNYAHIIGELMVSVMQNRGECIYYSNTCMPRTVRLLKLAGMRNVGPLSCEKIHFYVFQWGTLCKAVLAKHHVRIPLAIEVGVNAVGWLVSKITFRRFKSKTTSVRIFSIDDETFNEFWQEYLRHNDGVVTSRTARELRWLFSDGLLSGRFIMIARKIKDRIVGYVVLKTQDSEVGLRWIVSDWIAMRNDKYILHDLLQDARAAAMATDAMCMELTGFPMVIQPVVKSCLPLVRKAVCNTFLYKLYDTSFTESLLDTPDRGWFWGPMDGDRCVN